MISSGTKLSVPERLRTLPTAQLQNRRKVMKLLDPKMTPPSTNILAFSGGADSTAMAYELHRFGESFVLLHTPTGDELPGVWEHIVETATKLAAPLVLPTNHTLDHYIKEFNALPNNRQRWCTRLIKIEPCIAYLKRHPGMTLLVGLRADEPEREGLYGDYAEYRYPLREWGWDRARVISSLAELNVNVPKRTDCACCPYQRLGEWRDLYLNHREAYDRAQAYEELTGYTFRSPGRDKWPAELKFLRQEFDRGRKIRGTDRKRSLKVLNSEVEQACRVCRE